VVFAASAVISDSAGRVVLIKRGTVPDRGLWSVPGGCVESGESFTDAAAREAHEETGLTGQIGRELWCVRVPISDGRVYEIHDFTATVIGGSLCAGDDADDVRWISVEELDSIPLTANLPGYRRNSGLTGPSS